MSTFRILSIIVDDEKQGRQRIWMFTDLVNLVVITYLIWKFISWTPWKDLVSRRDQERTIFMKVLLRTTRIPFRVSVTVTVLERRRSWDSEERGGKWDTRVRWTSMLYEKSRNLSGIWERADPGPLKDPVFVRQRREVQKGRADSPESDL